MNTIFAPLLAAGSLCTLFAQTPDPYMGDWQGTLRLQDQSEQKVAVYMIPHGEGRYEAKIVSAFNERVPTLYQLRGRLQGQEGVFIDAIPFEVSRVVRAAEDGVVVRAGLWKGSLSGNRFAGELAGAQTGLFALRQTERISPTLGANPPPGAVVLFDGKNLDRWIPRDPNQKQIEWKLLDDGSMEVKGGDIMSRDTFRDQRLHLEFRLPYLPHARGQDRANSGVYLIARYEVQVLDSYGLEGEDNECGGIYQIAKPRVNMCAPPLQWQSYDITFRAARFENGRKTANARITIVHNGVTIHDQIELPRVTGGAINNREQEPGGLLLQDHGNPVRFRNIWVERLD